MGLTAVKSVGFGLILFVMVSLVAGRTAEAGGCPTYSDAESRYLGEGDLSSCSCWDLDLLRNEVFARHGRIFKREDLKYYFMEKSWYRPDKAKSGVEGQNKFEKKNVATIQNYEETRGCVASKEKGAGDTNEILAAARRFVDANSGPDMKNKYKLKVANRVGKWAIVSVLPTVNVEGASVILEKVGDKWIARDMGTSFEEWEEKVPELFK